MSVTINGTSGVTFNDASSQTTAATGFGFKNRIINGAMVIDQRNAGASVSASLGVLYTLDRFASVTTVAAKFTVQQNAGSVTPPTGFSNYLGVTSSSAYSVLSSDYFTIQQAIEGYNIADLAWGTASAATVTLSFWVRSSLTGTFGGAIYNNAADRSYPFTYTISSANTWEQKSITIAGDTTGTWVTTNGAGMRINWGLGVGSTASGTAGSWSGSLYRSATGATSVVGTNGATFYITGVQLEKGSTATSFDYRPYGTELALCQRYYEKSYNTDVAPAAVTTVGMRFSSGNVGASTTSFLSDGLTYKVTKRGTPTLVIYDGLGASGKCSRENFGVTNTNGSSVTTSVEGNNNALIYSSGTASSNSIAYHYTISSEL